MAVPRLRHTTLPHFENRDIATRPSSLAETIQVYHEGIPPATPLKDAKYTKASRQKSLADTLGLFHTNNMYSSAKVYHFDDVNNPHRWDSVLDPPFASYFDPKIEDSLSHLVDFAHESTETLGDTYNSFESSRSISSPRQSLLPPLPKRLLSSEAPFIRRSPCAPQKPFRTTPVCEQLPRKLEFGSLSKRIITPTQPDRLGPSPPPAVFCRSRTPSPPFTLPSNFSRPVATSVSSVATSATATGLDSSMSPSLDSDTISSPKVAGSSLSSPTRRGTMVRTPRKSHRRANIARPETLTSTVHERSISLPLATKLSSPIGADFDLGLPCNFETRRHSPTPPIANTSVKTAPLTSGRTISPRIQSTSLAVRPSPEPLKEEPVEVSAFDSDSDSDDEGTSPSGTIIRKMVSRPLLKVSRTRAKTVPAAKGRNVSKGASLPRRVYKCDNKVPEMHFSEAPEDHEAGQGILTPRISDSSTITTSALALSDVDTATSPITLGKKMSNGEFPSPKPERTSDASKTSKRSGTFSKHPAASATPGGNVAASTRKRQSGKRLRMWFAPLFGRQKTI